MGKTNGQILETGTMLPLDCIFKLRLQTRATEDPSPEWDAGVARASIWTNTNSTTAVFYPI